MNIIFQVNGGIGKNVMATAVVAAIRNNYPDANIYVLSAWVAVWLHNTTVDRVYKIGHTPYFYKDFILDKDVKILVQEPYLHSDYISKKRHLIQCWCDLCGIEYNNEPMQIYLTPQEKYIASKFQDQRETLIFQDRGGAPNKNQCHSWVRDIPPPQTLELLAKLSQKYNIIRIKGPNLNDIQGVNNISFDNIRELFALVERSNKFLVIDSCVQHIAKAFGKKATVLWPIDNIKILGYGSHTNIVSTKADPTETAYLEGSINGWEIQGIPHQSIFKDDNVFDVDKVLNSLL